MALRRRHVVNGWERAARRAANGKQGSPTGLFPLDLDFDYGCPSKRKVPRRGETPHLY